MLSGGQHNLVMGLIFVVLGLVCAFERGGLGAVLKKSLLFRGALHPLFGLEEWELPDGRFREHLWWMLLSGVALGVLSVAFSPFTVLAGVLGVTAILLILYKPETGLVCAAFLFPFVSRTAVGALVLLTHLSLAGKISVGKRSLVRSPADLPVLLLIAYLLIRGGGAAVPYALYLSVYFLGAHLMRTAAWMRRVITAVILAVGVAAAASTAMGA